MAVLGVAEHPSRAPIARSPQWRRVRAEWLVTHPRCAACGNARRSQLEVHHRVPFHVDASRELDPTNLITLCVDGPGVHCHLHYGHAGDWRLVNPDVDQAAAAALAMVTAARRVPAPLVGKWAQRTAWEWVWDLVRRWVTMNRP